MTGKLLKAIMLGLALVGSARASSVVVDLKLEGNTKELKNIINTSQMDYIPISREAIKTLAKAKSRNGSKPVVLCNGITEAYLYDGSKPVKYDQLNKLKQLSEFDFYRYCPTRILCVEEDEKMRFPRASANFDDTIYLLATFSLCPKLAKLGIDTVEFERLHNTFVKGVCNFSQRVNFKITKISLEDN
jgi:hypothetical protein